MPCQGVFVHDHGAVGGVDLLGSQGVGAAHQDRVRHGPAG